jgi:putative oxidoreductase
MTHIPLLLGSPLLGFVAIIAGFCGGLGSIIGLLGHVAAFGILVNMIVAVAMVHSRVGFFMNWTALFD